MFIFNQSVFVDCRQFWTRFSFFQCRVFFESLLPCSERRPELVVPSPPPFCWPVLFNPFLFRLPPTGACGYRVSTTTFVLPKTLLSPLHNGRPRAWSTNPPPPFLFPFFPQVRSLLPLPRSLATALLEGRPMSYKSSSPYLMQLPVSFRSFFFPFPADPRLVDF